MIPWTLPVRGQIIEQAVFEEGQCSDGGETFAAVMHVSTDTHLHLASCDERGGAKTDDDIPMHQAETETAIQKILAGSPGSFDLCANQARCPFEQLFVDAIDMKTCR